MVTCSYGYTQLIEQCAEVHGMNIADIEADDGITAIVTVSVDVYALNGTQLLEGISGEILFVGKDIVHAQRRNIVEGFG